MTLNSLRSKLGRQPLLGAVVVLLYALFAGFIDSKWDDFVLRTGDRVMGEETFIFYGGPIAILTSPFVVGIYMLPLVWIFQGYKQNYLQFWTIVFVSMGVTFTVSHIRGDDLSLPYMLISLFFVFGGSVLGVMELIAFDAWRKWRRSQGNNLDVR